MGAIDTSYTFTATDVITSTKMNNILDQSTMTATAIIGATLSVTAAGKLFVSSGGITSNEIGSNAVTTTSILDAAVTPAKLSNSDFGDFTVASGVATIDANAVTATKLASDSVETIKVKNANITASKLDGSQTGTAPIFGIRAWVTFNGINGAIIENGNVASVTRVGVGLYNIVFSQAMPSANYAVMGTGKREEITNRGTCIDVDHTAAKTTTTVKIRAIAVQDSPAPVDVAQVYVAFIG